MMKKQNVIDNVVCSMSFIISPLLSVPLYIRGIKAGNKSGFYFLCLVFAIFGAFLPPISDAYRYREIYYAGEAVNWSILYLDDSTKDWLYWFLSYVLNNYISFEIFKFLLSMACYFSYTWMFLDIVKRNSNILNNRRVLLIAWFAILFSIRLFTINQGIRFGVAATFVTVAIYLFSLKKYFKSISLYFVAFSMHFSTIIFIPIVCFALLAEHIKIHKYIKLTLFLILLIFFNSYISVLSSNYLDNAELLASAADSYMSRSGYWATESLLSVASLGGLLFTVARIVPIFPLLYYYFKSNQHSFLSYVSFGGIMLLCISISSLTLILRYSNITIALLFITFLINYKGEKGLLKVCLYSFVFVFGCYFYTTKDYIFRAYQIPALICPLPFIYENPYTDAWVVNNVSFQGELK